MRVLFDTSTFIWAITAPDSISPAARDAIETADELMLSVVSAWEATIKSALGKLRLESGVQGFFDQSIELTAVTLLPISLPHALGVADLPLLHRDPFDRLLIAQARHEDLTIVTNDPQIARYDVAVVW